MDPESVQGLLAALGGGVFGLVWLGLATNVSKIAGRTKHPPSFDPLLNFAHLGRFGGWALVGAATLGSDPWTGAMLLVTRLPAAALVGVTFVQRSVLRPPARLLVRRLGPGLGTLALACAALAWWGPGAVVAAPVAFLPPAPALAYVLHGLVLACFALQAVYALPRQIAEARHKPLGNLRWFQLALLFNYGYAFFYSWVAREALVQLVMRTAYGIVFVEQALLVLLIERGVRAHRATKAATP